jgi:hypothetical protein
MVLCPVALAVGCRSCPIFAVCPAKSVIGDQASAETKPSTEKPKAKAKTGGRR